ncbi:MAG: class I SAM-dependent methyltransferase family protein [Candidatus Bathyarchaeota archaeon]|nr:class I SAM-dependent methyltransferase family protein [Candidatus Bathyarchaeota archaeon]
MRKRRRERLGSAVAAGDSVGAYNSFDIVGDIAVTKIPPESQTKAADIAKAIMSRHKNVKAVFTQTSAVCGDYRLRKLTFIAGEKRTRTVHRESGCIFAVDLDKCYFSPRLLGERQRIFKMVAPAEVVVNLFAGVGCFSILIAKQVPSAKVYSIDVNPDAFQFMQENIHLNRVPENVVPLLGDAKAIIESRLQGCADRVLMPLPEKAMEYLPAAVSTLKPSGGWLHIHLFEHAAKTEDPAEKAKQSVTDALYSLGVDFEVPFVRIVRSTGPHFFQLVVDAYIFPS